MVGARPWIDELSADISVVALARMAWMVVSSAKIWLIVACKSLAICWR